MKLHRKLKHNEKVCRAHELGFYAQGQVHNQAKGQIKPKIVLLIYYWSKFDETSQKDKAYWEGVSRIWLRVPTPKVKVAVRSEAKVVSQQ